ncbi:MAG: hypothetical protein HXY40_08475 [Chloroflexi bacterium]|nr:hypothetical protein [Chloroflexota bacterium]
MQSMSQSPREQPKSAIMGLLIAVIFVVLVLWGGFPTGERVTPFVISLVVFIGVTFVFGLAVWHLLVRPLPAGHKQPQPLLLTAAQRQWMALLLLVSSISLTIGSLWDEIWHRQYGIPFGDDFFWRPHLMMYAGLLITIVLAMIGWYIVLRQGQGTLQQRFRANPVFGLIVLVGTFLIYALPTDPIWHQIMGGDISAWSIPHVLFAINFSLIMISGVAIYMTIFPAQPWRSLLRFQMRDLIPLASAAFVSIMPILLLTSEWDGPDPSVVANAAVLNRPDWLFPALLAFTAAFVGLLANHTLRTYGGATAAAVLSLIIRVLMLSAFQAQGITANAWLLLLPPALTLDVWYGLWTRRTGEAPPLWQAVLAIVAGMGVSLLFMGSLYVYPSVTLASAVPMLLSSVVAAWIAGWLARTIGDYVALSNKQAIVEAREARWWLSPLVFALAAAFIAWFMVTAAPPIL